VKQILILGAGFGGLETATGLSQGLGDGYEITLVDRSDSFFIGFSKIDVLFGRRTEAQVRYRYADLRAPNVRFVQATIEAIDTDARAVTTSAGVISYDTLVVALGADLDPDATPGFRESGGHEFFSMPGAVRLRPVLEGFSSGTLVLGILGAPYKCPPAPYEVAYQMHEHFVQRGVRDRITMKMVIPSPRAVPNPGVADALERLLAERKIELVPSAPIASIDAANRQVVHASGTIPYDLFIGVPVHVPPKVIRTSKLTDKGFVQPSPVNLETAVPNVYAIGDVTKIPVGENAVPKAGAFAEDAARTVVSDILRKAGRGGELLKFKAQGACYFELGNGQVAKVDADFLGGDKPKQTVAGPSADFYPDKLEFETTRRDRWFKPRQSP
jgi:sulfide:quinone oxidoreductase